MFPHFIQEQVDELRPAAAAAADTTRAYADRIVSLLEGIRDGVNDDEWQETRRYIGFTFPQPGGATTLSLGQVPTDTEWIVEVVTMDNVNGGTPVVARVTGNGQSQWLGSVPANGVATLPGSGVLLRQGSEVALSVTGAATTMTGLVQMKMRTKVPRSKALGAATFQEPPPDDRQSGESTTPRHAPLGVFHGQNIRGERADQVRVQ